MSEYIIALDAMGGDNAPEAIVAGGVLALRRYADVRILLCGPGARLEALLSDAGDVRDRVEIIPAGEVIGMDESPMLAVRRKADSSLVKAMMAVREKRAGAVVSASALGFFGLLVMLLVIERIAKNTSRSSNPASPARIIFFRLRLWARLLFSIRALRDFFLCSYPSPFGVCVAMLNPPVSRRQLPPRF